LQQGGNTGIPSQNEKADGKLLLLLLIELRFHQLQHLRGGERERAVCIPEEEKQAQRKGDRVWI
jgi:hypothetical protein